MKTKKILVTVVVAISFLTMVVFAQAQEAPSKLASPLEDVQSSISASESIPNTAECFDYYKFGSVQVDVESEIASTSSGIPMTFRATIKNENNYPIVAGAVYAKVFRKQEDENNIHANGNFLVDQFFVQDNISLDSGGQKVIDFDWNVPSYALSGDYQIAMFFTSVKKFNLLGLSFTDDVAGNTVDFTVAGEIEQNVEFDKNTVDINETNYHFAAFPPRFKDEDIQIKTDLVNFTGESQIIPVIYKLYSWDGQTEENLLETRNETIQIDSNKTKQLSYTITDKSFPVYYLVVEADWQDSKSILDIRTVRETANRVRINFPSITSYPLKQNEKNTFFVCAHNSGTAGIVENNKLVVSILDENQEEIHQYVYEGPISGAMMGLKEEFIPKENYSNFSIKTDLYTDGQLVDSALMRYDCQDINPEACLSASQSKPASGEKESSAREMIIMIAVVLTILLIIAIATYTLVKNKKSGVNLLLIFGFVALSVAFGGAPKAEAKSVVWSENWNNVYSLGYIWVYPADRKLLYFQENQVSIKYNAILQNAHTGTVINDGASVPIGTWINVDTQHVNSDISWFGTGYSNDSPYGYWKYDAYLPVPEKDLCRDFLARSTGTGWYVDYYANLSVNQPKKIITYSGSGTAGLVCTDASRKYCKVTSPGTVKINIEFAGTYAKWWFATNSLYSAGSPTCRYFSFANTPAIPSQSIVYDLNVSAPNQPPAIPTITGPNTGITNTNYTFSFSSTDPENNSLRYLVWWSNDDGTAWLGSQWVPATGTVASGIAQSITRKWLINGNKRIAALACDDLGNCSNYAYHAIAISTPTTPPTPTSTFSCTGTAPANATLIAGDDLNLTVNAVRKAVASDTADKCEYMCNSPYTFDGVSSCDCAVSCAECSADCDGGTQVCTDCHGSTISNSCNTQACPIEGIDNNWREVSP
jgi:hypothetical protein